MQPRKFFTSTNVASRQKFRNLVQKFKNLEQNLKNCIKTHDSESQDQEEAGLGDKPVSYLHVAPL